MADGGSPVSSRRSGFDSCLVAFHQDASDHDGNNVVRDWAPQFGMDITRLADVEALIERLLTENLRAGGRSFKFAWAYDRTLSVGAPDRQAAERAMGRAPGTIEPALQLAFGDYVVQHVLDRARDLRSRRAGPHGHGSSPGVQSPLARSSSLVRTPESFSTCSMAAIRGLARAPLSPINTRTFAST